MQSDTHEKLYRRLQDVNATVNDLLEKRDYEALPAMLNAQQTILQDLETAGPCRDRGQLALLVETRNMINDTMRALKTRRDDLAGQLKTNGNKRKLVRAYGT